MRGIRTQFATQNPHVVKRRPVREPKLPPWMMKMWMSTLPSMISRAWWATSCIWVALYIWLESKGFGGEGQDHRSSKHISLTMLPNAYSPTRLCKAWPFAAFFLPACKHAEYNRFYEVDNFIRGHGSGECVANHRCLKKNHCHPKHANMECHWPDEILPNFEAWGSNICRKFWMIDFRYELGYHRPEATGRVS